MAKKENTEHEEVVKAEMTKEERIKNHQEEIRRLRTQGTFKSAYKRIRKGTVEISKNDSSEEEKKTQLGQLMLEVQEEMMQGE